MSVKSRQYWEGVVDAEGVLKGLSPSAVAEWKLFRDTGIAIAMASESIQVINKTDVETNNDNKQYGTIPWWIAIAKEFQNGDSWVVDTLGRGKYELIDPAKQIVKYVAAIEDEESGFIFIKAAKDVAGVATQLTPDELTAFRNYLKARRPPGSLFIANSLPSDSVKYILQYRYNPSYNKATLETAIDQVLADYKANLPFNAIVYKSQLVALIELIPGIESVVIRLDMTLKSGTVVVLDVAELQELPAGHFNYDVTSTKTGIAV